MHRSLILKKGVVILQHLFEIIFLKFFVKNKKNVYLWCSLIVALLCVGGIVSSSFDLMESASAKNESVTTIEISKALKNEIPKDVFGGLYWDEQGNVTVNITDPNKIKELANSDVFSEYDVKYNLVSNSLSFLESVMNLLVPHMKEFNIATIDANDITNKLDIELYSSEKRTLLEKFLLKVITLDCVNISLLSDNITFEFTHGSIDDGSSSNGYYYDM